MNKNRTFFTPDVKKILIWCLRLLLTPMFFIAMFVPVIVMEVEEIAGGEEEPFINIYSTHISVEYIGTTLDDEDIRNFDSNFMDGILAQYNVFVLMTILGICALVISLILIHFNYTKWSVMSGIIGILFYTIVILLFIGIQTINRHVLSGGTGIRVLAFHTLSFYGYVLGLITSISSLFIKYRHEGGGISS